MAAPTQTPPSSPPFAKGSIIWEKKGPLPVWAWALIVLGLLLLWSWWRRNKATGDATAVATGDETTLPGDQTPPPVFILPQATPPAVNVTVPVTVPTAPPAGGSPPPVAPPPTATTPKPKPVGEYVPVGSYARREWNSTISGIWAHFSKPGPSGKTNAPNWQAIWNHPLNADLRKKRGKPEKIQPNDQVFVPGIVRRK